MCGLYGRVRAQVCGMSGLLSPGLRGRDIAEVASVAQNTITTSVGVACAATLSVSARLERVG